MPPPLPTARTSFFGRARELDALAAALARGARLVTVAGPAGIGKTRLARAFLERAGRVEGFFCDLSETRGADDVVSAVALALGVPLGAEDGPRDAEARVGAALASRRDPLVVLDNFEQVVAHAPATVGRWLDAAPRARFVVTSRERLQLAGETLFELDALPSRESVDLFQDRARLVRPDYEPRGEEARAVRALVERLDGNPLAIELAAARAGTLSAADLLERLGQRFDILRSSRRDAPARQLSLRAALDSSWELLSPFERTALSQCAVFRGGFTLAAAEAVLAPGGARAVEAVHALRDKSLLRLEASTPRGGARFRLYESVREYALERFASAADESAAKRRHAEYFAEQGTRWAEASHGHDGIAALEAMSLERDNLLAVARGEHTDDAALCVRAAASLDPLLSRRGPFETHREVMESARARASEPPLRGTALECDALLAWSRVWLVRGRLSGLAEALDRAASVADSLGDAAHGAYARVLRGYSFWAVGDFAAARAVLHDALEVAQRAGHGRHEGSAWMYLGMVTLSEGDFAGGTTMLERAAALFRAAGAERYTAIALAIQARGGQAAGQFESALAAAREATRLFARVTDTLHEAKLHARVASLLRELGRAHEARPLAERALVEARTLGDPVAQVEALVELGWLDLFAGRTDDARARAQDAWVATRGGVWVETRKAVTDLEAAIAARASGAGGVPGAGTQGAAPRVLEIARDGRWFRVGKHKVDLSRRGALRLILLALAHAREQNPGQGVSLEALVAAGWPRQKILPGSAASRVYTAVRTLRSMGLEGVLVTRDDGYLLDPGVSLRWPATE